MVGSYELKFNKTWDLKLKIIKNFLDTWKIAKWLKRKLNQYKTELSDQISVTLILDWSSNSKKWLNIFNAIYIL